MLIAIICKNDVSFSERADRPLILMEGQSYDSLLCEFFEVSTGMDTLLPALFSEPIRQDLHRFPKSNFEFRIT